MNHDYFEIPLDYYESTDGVQSGSTSSLKTGKVFSTASPGNLGAFLRDSIYVVGIRPSNMGDQLAERMLADPLLLQLADQGFNDLVAGRYDKL